ncbi:MAG: DUF4387 domain-containing protein [Puniceicoccaceae bacterium]|nr:MAG: DUF4387 domain-containing protein [Puniceicoccaceae bacterium]
MSAFSPSTAPLRALARVIRSKNSGPFELTLDVIFQDRGTFERVRAGGGLTAQVIARHYGLDTGLVKAIHWFAPASAVKVVLARTVVSGHPGDRDVYGAQQHAPLLTLEVPC